MDWNARITANVDRWRALAALWRDQARQTTPSDADTLDDLKARRLDFSAIAQAAIADDAAAVTETTAIHAAGMKAAADADKIFYAAITKANEALAASREALPYNVDLAEQYQQQAEEAQATAEAARFLGDLITERLAAQLNAAQDARAAMRDLIHAGERLAAALAGAGAGLEAAAAAGDNAGLIQQAQQALTEVAGAALGGLAALALLGAGLFVAAKLLKR